MYRFVDWYFFTPKPPSDGPPLPIEQYPWAISLIFVGGLVYAAIGLIFAIFAGPITADAATKAREEALDAVRSGFTSREAPRPADIIIRINEAVEVFRARVGRRSGARSLAGARSADFDNADRSFDDEIPPWRNRDSSVKFVETGFSSTPKEWRADPYVDFSSSNRRSEPGAKRGLFDLKKPSRD